MTHTLISLLGRTPKDQNGYRRTRYLFPGGEESTETAFIGWSLRERLHPDCLVILGTAGSMWDYLVESQSLQDAAEADRLELQEASIGKVVTQGLLDRIAPLLASALGCTVHLVIIPYGRDEHEQIEVLRLMAERVPVNAQVSLDVTHGFRHLPMLALLSALHLRVARNAQIAGIYYGAFDPDSGEARIHDLKGLLYIADWIGALNTFDKDGDYSVFAALLRPDIGPDCALLEEAAFFERSSRIGQARGKLRQFDGTLARTNLTGAAELFAPVLGDRIRWCYEDRLYQRQQVLARHHLKKGDYLRAALFAFEAFVTRLVQERSGNPDDFGERDNAKREYEAEAQIQASAKYKRYCLLRDLRNQLAHGSAATQSEVQRALSNAATLRQTLHTLFDELLPESQ